jgi:hypothetical protein
MLFGVENAVKKCAALDSVVWDVAANYAGRRMQRVKREMQQM